jgi:hypothetical protein
MFPYQKHLRFLTYTFIEAHNDTIIKRRVYECMVFSILNPTTLSMLKVKIWNPRQRIFQHNASVAAFSMCSYIHQYF